MLHDAYTYVNDTNCTKTVLLSVQVSACRQYDEVTMRVRTMQLSTLCY